MGKTEREEIIIIIYIDILMIIQHSPAHERYKDRCADGRLAKSSRETGGFVAFWDDSNRCSRLEGGAG